MTTITHSPSQTQSLGKKLAQNFVDGTVVCLRGNLGAGKTTLVQGIAKGLGIKRRISSPTFIIVRRYPRFWHIDLYRLTSLEEARAVGIEEILEDKTGVILIEWPEKIEEILPKKRWEIKMEIISEKDREISYEAVH